MITFKSISETFNDSNVFKKKKGQKLLILTAQNFVFKEYVTKIVKKQTALPLSMRLEASVSL